MVTGNSALETQLNNIQTRTGKSLEELAGIIRQTGLKKHGEIRKVLIDELGMGYGDANTLVHHVLQSDAERAAGGASTEDVLAAIYSGAKEHLRPIHERLMAEINQFGAFEIAPKKGYVSLRRKKQFAMIGPATNSRVEVGLNMKGAQPTTPRLAEVPPGGMCSHKVKLTEPSQIDKELIAWIRQAYEMAG